MSSQRQKKSVWGGVSVGLVLLAFVGVPAAQAEFLIDMTARYVSWEWESKYIGGSTGVGDAGTPLGAWWRHVSASPHSSDNRVALSVASYQDSLIETTALNVEDETRAYLECNPMLMGQSVQTTCVGRSSYFVRFLVTEETQVQFSSGSYGLSSTAGGLATMFVDLNDVLTGVSLYNYSDSVVDGTSNGHLATDLFTLYPDTVYSLRVATSSWATTDVVTNLKPAEAFAGGTYGLAIVPEPASLLILALGGLLTARRRA